MGIQAPTSSDTTTAIFTALLSYNRPFILIAVFLISFAVIMLISSRNKIVSLVSASLLTVFVASYFIITYLNRIRY